MRVYVYGWYGHGNLGDEAFKPAIQNLFPTHKFTFGDYMPDSINSYDELWIGGGSFLCQKVPGIDRVTIPIGFIGVGVPKEISPSNRQALDKAKFVVVRDSLSYQNKPNWHLAPDLVFSRKDITRLPRDPTKKVVVLLNEFFCPGWQCAEWQSLAHYRFNLEFSKICQTLVEEGYSLKFLPLCCSPQIDDRRAAASIISRMRTRYAVEWAGLADEPQLLGAIVSADLVITQRLHGAIYSAMLGVPFMVISGHDKLMGLVTDLGWHGFIDYYAFTDYEFFKRLKLIEGTKVSAQYCEEAKEKWSEIAKIIVR